RRSRVEEGCPDDGLDCVGEDRRLVSTPGQLLTTPETDVAAEPDRARHLGESDTADEARAALGQFTLVEMRVRRVEHDRDGLPENRVAKELEAFIVRQPTVFVRERTVGQRQLEKFRADRDRKLCGEFGRSGFVTAHENTPDNRLNVGYLAALVLEVQGCAGGILNDLRAVRKAVGGLAALDGLHQGGRRGLPLRATGTGARARHFALRYCHGYLFSSVTPLLASATSSWGSCFSPSSPASAAQRGSTGASCS